MYINITHAYVLVFLTHHPHHHVGTSRTQRVTQIATPSHRPLRRQTVTSKVSMESTRRRVEVARAARRTKKLPFWSTG